MTTLKLGSRGNDVKVLQHYLNLIEDGIFGPLTKEALINFQSTHNLTADGICGTKTWAALQATASSSSHSTTTTPITIGSASPTPLPLKRSTRSIKRIIVHCTASREGQHLTVDDIRRQHKSQGWSDIGYHYVVYLDGSIHDGRDVNKVGAHTQNYNSTSIGVVYVGGVLKTDGRTPKDTRTPAQKQGLLNLLRQLKRLYPTATIHGHREFANKSCPCFDAYQEYRTI